jgi:hypothetical protein
MAVAEILYCLDVSPHAASVGTDLRLGKHDTDLHAPVLSRQLIGDG